MEGLDAYLKLASPPVSKPTPTVRFEVPGKPVPWKRARRNGGRYFTDPAVLAHQQAVRWCFRKAYRGEPFDACSLRVVAVFPIPSRWPKYKQRAATVHTSKPDADNVAKLIMDAMNGIAWHDDARVHEVFVSKVYGEEPRTIVELYR